MEPLLIIIASPFSWEGKSMGYTLRVLFDLIKNYQWKSDAQLPSQRRNFMVVTITFQRNHVLLIQQLIHYDPIYIELTKFQDARKSHDTSIRVLIDGERTK